MKIFIMRHGEAEHFAPSDEQRQLTEKGKTASLAVARACSDKGFCHFDKVLVSPYIRAQQTWQVISNQFQAEQMETCQDITPYGEAEQVASYVRALIDIHQYQSLLLVSHLPLVGYLTAQFVADGQAPMFRTSGLICIEYSPEKMSGEIAFNLQA